MDSTDFNFFEEHAIFVLDPASLKILDVNKRAISEYGFDRDTFCGMNIRDLGEEHKRASLMTIESVEEEFFYDKFWIHHTASGNKKYVQFTSHRFNYQGKTTELAIAHDVSSQVQNEVAKPKAYPAVQLYRGDRPLAEVVWDANRNVKIWSSKAEQLFGWTKADTLGDENFFQKFVHPGEIDQTLEILGQRVEEGKKSYTAYSKIRTKSGEQLICQWHNTLVYDETGRLVTIYSLLEDVSERRESEQLFKALSEKSLVGIYLVQDGKFQYINPRFVDIFGYSRDEIVGQLGPLDLTHPDDRPWVGENLRKRLEGEVEALDFDFRCVTEDGETIHVRVYGGHINYLGKPAIVGSLLDITDAKAAHARYQASVENFEELFDSISDAIYIQDAERKFIKVNKAAVALNGYEKDFYIGNTPEALTAPGKVDTRKTQAYFKKALHGEPQHFEQWGKRKSGEVFPEEVFLKPGTYAGDDVVIAITQDVSARHEVQNEMQKSREKFQQLFNNAPFGITMMNKHQEIQTVNKAFENIFGYREQEIKGLDIDQLIVAEDQEDSARDISKKIFSGDAFSTVDTRKRKDGTSVDVLISGAPVNVNGRTIAIFGIYMDITERIKAEEKVKKSLKEKEVLLAEIHHRVKNNLAVITGLLELQQYNTEVEEAKDILRESQLRINSIALIHEKIYQNENLSEISIDVYLNELIDIITHSMGTGETEVNIIVDAPATFLTINQAIPCGLILNELITNAYKHAFPDCQSGKISIHLEKDDDQIKLTFEDDGVGMPEDVDMDNPDSLGLTLIRTLSRQLQGDYQFTNSPEGMRFELRFEFEE